MCAMCHVDSCEGCREAYLRHERDDTELWKDPPETVESLSLCDRCITQLRQEGVLW